jgi:hypothetical protein
MGIQINTQPQVFRTDTVIIGSNNNNNLSAVSGITVYGQVSASGGFSGDGSKLTGLVATGIAGMNLVNSIDGLTGNVVNQYVPLTGGKTITGNLTSIGNIILSSASLSAASVSGVHFGDGSNLTGIRPTSVNNLSGGNIVGTTNIVLSSASLSAASISGSHFGSGAGLTGITASSLTVSLVNSIDGLTGSVVNQYVPLTGGKTITGSLTSTGNIVLSSASLSAASVSGFHFGDGSNLTGITPSSLTVSLVNSIDGLTGTVNNQYLPLSGGKTITGPLTSTGNIILSSASLTADSVSATIFYGSAAGLTGIVATGIAGVSLVNSIDGLTGVVANQYVPLTGGKTITGSLTSSGNLTLTTGNLLLSTGNLTAATLNANTIVASGVNLGTTIASNSGTWLLGSVLSGSTGFGYKIVNNAPRIEGDLVINGRLSALSGATFFNTTFTTTSSLCVINVAPLSQVAFYVGASGTGDIASFYDVDAGVEILHIGGNNSTFKNVGVKTSAPNKDFTVSGEISSTGDAWFNNVNTHSTSGKVTAVSGIFTTVSGTHYGSGSNLTGVVYSIDGLTGNVVNQYVPLSGGKTITGSLTSTGNLILSSASLTATSVSATNFYGSGSNLTGVVYSIDGLTGNVVNQYVPLSGGKTITGSLTSSGNLTLTTGNLLLSTGSLTAVNGTFTTSLSTPSITAVNGTFRTSLSSPSITATNGMFSSTLSTVTISADNLVISGYPLQSVSRVYQVGTAAATSTYTLALSDNNNTLTMFVGTSGLIIIPNTITFPIGFQTNIMQLSTGRVLLSAQGANLYNDMNSFRTYKQYSAATVINLGSIWVTYGSLSS